MGKFIYVFSVDEKDILEKAGYNLLRSDDTKNIYIFVNEDRTNFNFSNAKYVISDTLIF